MIINLKPTPSLGASHTRPSTSLQWVSLRRQADAPLSTSIALEPTGPPKLQLVRGSSAVTITLV